MKPNLTQEEFDLWWDDYADAFPDAATWVTEKGGDNVLSRWYDAFVLKRLTLAELKAATAAMLTGEAPAPNNFERDKTSALVCKAALEWRETHPNESRYSRGADAEGHAPGPLGPHSTGLYETLCKMAVNGVSQVDRAKWLEQQFGNSDDKRDWKACTLCRDTGFVQIISAARLSDYVRIVEQNAPIGSATATCSCAAGDKIADTRRFAPRRFDTRFDVRIRPTDQATRETVRAFLAEYEANRQPAKTLFNQNDTVRF